jgi:protein PhnA
MLPSPPKPIWMKLEEIIQNRSNNHCELCGAENTLSIYEVPQQTTKNADSSILICNKCKAQLEKKEDLDAEHWKALSNTMWSEVPGVQVVAWRMLNRLRNESWAADNLDLLYLDDEKLEWAKATGDHLDEGAAALHKDAYGNVLATGDTVLLTQSLNVKGASVNARVGTIVRNIRLVENNTEQIEGKIEGQVIVILTKYVKKQVT